MRGGYDGSIKIDTRIDAKGFNAGMKKLSASAGNFGKVMVKALAGIAIAFAVLVAVIAVVAAALVGVVVVVAKLGARMFEMLADSISHADAFYATIQNLQTAFSDLRGAFLAAFATLLNAVAPAIQIVVDWLIKALNVASMVVAALTGQKTAMQYVAGSMADAAKSSGGMAKNTQKAERAAKGALAAFDELNVLQRQEPAEPEAGLGGGGAVGGGMRMEEVEVPEDYLDTLWETIKTKAKETWESVKQWFADAWTWIKADGANWAADVAQSVVDWFVLAWENIKLWAADAWEWIKTTWGVVGEWFNTNVVTPVKNWFAQAWEDIKAWASGAWASIKTAWAGVGTWFKTNVTEPVAKWFKTAWENIKSFAVNAWNGLVNTWQGAKDWIKTKVTDPVKEAFKTALDWVKEKWETVFAGVTNFVKGRINLIIDFINAMIRAIAKGINSIIGSLNSLSYTVPDWVPGFGGNTFGFNIPLVSAPQIPRLATGAVIPANAEFLAILGDQRHGRNIEAPEGLIRKIMAEVLADFGGGEDLLVEMPVYLDSEVIYRGQKRVQRRRGKSLIVGGTA